jgi:outer membrane protein OmpA-like peptidoglycan-associated protein
MGAFVHQVILSAAKIGAARRGLRVSRVRALPAAAGLGLVVAFAASCSSSGPPFIPAPAGVRELPDVQANPLPPLSSFVTESNGDRVATVSSDFLFDLDSATLRSDSKTSLSKVLPAIRNSTGQVSVIGFTDGLGTGPANLHLSKARAVSVRTWLVSEGVSAARIVVSGKGEAGAKKGVADARARRVEIVLKGTT